MTTIRASINLDARWNRVPGIRVSDGEVEIDVERYFYRYEDPAWRIVPWEKVQQHWDTLDETSESALEQNCLEFISSHSRQTQDPCEVLENAEKAYTFLFREDRDDLDGLPYLTSSHLKILREVSTLMALNKVDRDGCARNVGPAWFFPICSQEVFNLTDKETEEVDELYHGGFFLETRRVESIKAHTALGGRLVHGCSGKPDMSGGCVLEYGASIEGFHADLRKFRDPWMQSIRSW